MAIEGITPLNTGRIQLKQPSLAEPNEKVSFKDLLDTAITQVNEMQKGADQKIALYAAGQITDPHEVTIAVEEAHLALQYTMQIRNKLLEAYQEIMRMQV